MLKENERLKIKLWNVKDFLTYSINNGQVDYYLNLGHLSLYDPEGKEIIKEKIYTRCGYILNSKLSMLTLDINEDAKVFFIEAFILDTMKALLTNVNLERPIYEYIDYSTVDKSKLVTQVTNTVKFLLNKDNIEILNHLMNNRVDSDVTEGNLIDIRNNDLYFIPCDEMINFIFNLREDKVTTLKLYDLGKFVNEFKAIYGIESHHNKPMDPSHTEVEELKLLIKDARFFPNSYVSGLITDISKGKYCRLCNIPVKKVEEEENEYVLTTPIEADDFVPLGLSLNKHFINTYMLYINSDKNIKGLNTMTSHKFITSDIYDIISKETDIDLSEIKKYLSVLNQLYHADHQRIRDFFNSKYYEDDYTYDFIQLDFSDVEQINLNIGYHEDGPSRTYKMIKLVNFGYGAIRNDEEECVIVADEYINELMSNIYNLLFKSEEKSTEEVE